jgi:hypothetical protein
MKRLLFTFLSILFITFLSYAQWQWEIGPRHSSRGSGFLISDQRDYVFDAFDGSFSSGPEQAAPSSARSGAPSPVPPRSPCPSTGSRPA